MQELDVVNVVKTLRSYKQVAQALLTKKHMIMLKF